MGSVKSITKEILRTLGKAVMRLISNAASVNRRGLKRGITMGKEFLLTGKNVAVIDTFYNQLWDVYDCMTTSIRFQDINRHLDKYKPDAFIYCMNNELTEDIENMSDLKKKLVRIGVPVILIGAVEETDSFQKITYNAADLIINKPLTSDKIQSAIDSFFGSREADSIRVMREIEKEAEAERKKHILVVDDDPMMLKVIKENLHEKYDVATAKGGQIAYKFLEKRGTDLILMDYEMPGETGPEVVRKIRQMPNCANIPCVFLSGISDKEKLAKAVAVKPQGYLLKPIDRNKLIEKISSLIG